MPIPEPMTDEELAAKQALRQQKQIQLVPLDNEWSALNREAAAKNALFKTKKTAADALRTEIASLKSEIDTEITRRAGA